jgi:endonuclease/exonuclease/phosphatase family metal-dependent hydrolase
MPKTLTTYRILITLTALLFAQIATAEELSICSFNVKWLGSYPEKENNILAQVVGKFDIVVIQEITAPPYPMNFPDGTPCKPDKESAGFFDAMTAQGFKYWLSDENTGPGEKNHTNSTATEWWAMFYKPDKVTPVKDIPHGFIAEDRTRNPDYSRVPYAFSFRCGEGKTDFVLINVHLNHNTTEAGKERRKHELSAIAAWIKANDSKEKDFIILGDCNVQDTAELMYITPEGFISLNISCMPTNTSLRNPKPYDHVFYRPDYSKEIKRESFGNINLINECGQYWRDRSEPYPGDPYNFQEFQKHFSDHKPVYFKLDVTIDDD